MFVYITMYVCMYVCSMMYVYMYLMTANKKCRTYTM